MIAYGSDGRDIQQRCRYEIRDERQNNQIRFQRDIRLSNRAPFIFAGRNKRIPKPSAVAVMPAFPFIFRAENRHNLLTPFYQDIQHFFSKRALTHQYNSHHDNLTLNDPYTLISAHPSKGLLQ